MPNRRQFTAVVFFLSSFWLVAASIYVIFPPRTIGGKVIESKLQEFLSETPYTTLVLGTSRVRGGFDPFLFDQENRAAGVESLTFNFGVAGLTFEEADMILRRVRDAKKPSLTHVVYEPDPRSYFSRVRPDWDRARSYFSPRATLRFIEIQLARHNSRYVQVFSSLTAISLLIRQLTNPGRLSNAFLIPNSDGVDFSKNRGYVPYSLDSMTEINAARRHEFIVSLESSKVRARELSDPNYWNQVPQHDPRTVDFINDFVSKQNSRTFEVSIKTYPTLLGGHSYSNRFRPTKEEDHFSFPVFIILGGDRFPDLYETDVFFDAVHLNQEGAEMFTKEFSRLFRAEYFESNKP